MGDEKRNRTLADAWQAIEDLRLELAETSNRIARLLSDRVDPLDTIPRTEASANAEAAWNAGFDEGARVTERNMRDRVAQAERERDAMREENAKLRETLGGKDVNLAAARDEIGRMFAQSKKLRAVVDAASDAVRVMPTAHRNCNRHADPECGYCSCGYEGAQRLRDAIREADHG